MSIEFFSDENPVMSINEDGNLWPPSTIAPEKKLTFLIDKIRTMNNAINNEAPDLALLEIDRVNKIIDGWDDEQPR